LLQRDSLAMTRCTRLLHNMLHHTGTLLTLLVNVVRFLRLCLRPAPVLAAENLFLRKQLALYQERHVTPRRATDATRFALVWLARWFDWRQALAVVQPGTLTRWHRQAFRLFWRWKSTCGSRIPVAVEKIGVRRVNFTPLFVRSDGADLWIPKTRNVSKTRG
jgi:hypothetical protein